MLWHGGKEGMLWRGGKEGGKESEVVRLDGQVDKGVGHAQVEIARCSVVRI